MMKNVLPFKADRSVLKQFWMPAIALIATLGLENSILAQSSGAQLSGAQSARVPVPQLDKSSSAKSTSNKSSQTKYIRVTRTTSGAPLAMQTAITRFRPAKGELVVDLIGAVHIGESQYYRQLNRQFELYDSVLYELVAPKGTRIPKGGKKKSSTPNSPLDLVGWMQSQTQTQLGLQSQLALIDYQKKNFVHADLSPTEMGEKMAERGDTPLTIGLSALSEMIKQQNRSSNASSNNNLRANSDQAKRESLDQLTPSNLMEVLGDPLKMKRMMANQFSDSGVMDQGFGNALNQLLVVDRNEAAMRVLQKQIASGNKKIAIFYGAAHMPDFEERLVKNFGLKKTKQVWVDAWDLTKSGTKTPENSASKMLMRLLEETLK
jgi:hypothetical protein